MKAGMFVNSKERGVVFYLNGEVLEKVCTGKFSWEMKNTNDHTGKI